MRGSIRSVEAATSVWRLALGAWLLAFGFAMTASAGAPPRCCALVLDLASALDSSEQRAAEDAATDSASREARVSRLGAMLRARFEAAFDARSRSFDSAERPRMTRTGEHAAFALPGMGCARARRFIEDEVLAGDRLGLRVGEEKLVFDSRTVSEAGPGPKGEQLQLVLSAAARSWLAATTRAFEGAEARVLVDGQESGGRIPISGEIGTGWISLGASQIGHIEPSRFRLPIVGRLEQQAECFAESTTSPD